MAIVDQQTHAIVLGIVYDGPPEAGKTTSLRALARGFGREVYTPEEQHGRTVYFDWLEHTGGRFDGAPIRCQIVTVPGQERWLSRRTHLLARADVVVFVGDTTAGAWTATLQQLRDLCARMDARDGPPVAVVFQANRRDAPDALDIDSVRRQVASQRVAVVESVAVEGTGIREAFVFAVRLALDRVREEQRLGLLRESDLKFDGNDLFAQMQGLESAPFEEPPAAPIASAANDSASEHASTVRPAKSSEQSGLPSQDVPSGLIWPPIEGRILLRDAMLGVVAERGGDALDPRVANANGYRIRSDAHALFGELEAGRNALIGWARAHASAQPFLSRRRCIVLAALGEGRFRLWQIVRQEASLRDLFVDGCETLIPRHAARQLASASRSLAEAHAVCADRSLTLDCTLDTIGLSDSGEPVYVGDVPAHATAHDAQSAEQLARELATLLGDRTASDRAELCNELRLVQRHDHRSSLGNQLGELLSQLLLQ